MIMSDKCPLCNGEGRRIVIVKHAMSQLPKITSDWCLCMKAKFVASTPNYKLLRRVNENQYIPFEDIDSQLDFDPNNLSGSTNLLIRSNPEELFFLNLKSVIMKYRFDEPSPTFLCCQSIDILKMFYVQQGDGSTPQLSDVNAFDLVVFTLDNREKNDQLKTCIAQVVYNRLAIRKPTWIFMNKPTLSSCVYEYSEEFEEHLNKRFKKIELEGKKEEKSKKVKANASSFSRLVS